MIDHDDKEIETFINELFKDSGYSHRKITISRDSGKLYITVDQMYEFIECNFAKLTEMSKYFDTVNFDVDEWFHSGCESCDYGSSYNKKFTLW